MKRMKEELEIRQQKLEATIDFSVEEWTDLCILQLTDDFSIDLFGGVNKSNYL